MGVQSGKLYHPDFHVAARFHQLRNFVSKNQVILPSLVYIAVTFNLEQKVTNIPLKMGCLLGRAEASSWVMSNACRSQQLGETLES